MSGAGGRERPRTYAITGSASGIGAATAALLRSEGHRVIGVDVVGAEVIADLANATGRAAMIDAVRDLSAGALDGVIACAGIGGGEGEPEPIIRVNYFGARATLVGLRPLLARGSEPRAVAVASIAALRPGREDPIVAACIEGDEEGAVTLAVRDGTGTRAYGASKRALARLVRQLAPTDDWSGAGIAVNAVGPGVIDTPMAGYLLASPERRAQTAREVPMPLGGVGRADEIASLLAWLTSPVNGLVTGQLIFADGGFDALTRGDDVW